jgi:hypothetical protein
MRHVRLGQTELQVSAVAFGTGYRHPTCRA